MKYEEYIRAAPSVVRWYLNLSRPQISGVVINERIRPRPRQWILGIPINAVYHKWEDG